MRCAACGVRCGVCSVRRAVCGVQCAVCSVRCAACGVRCAMCNVLCAVCGVQCAVCSVRCAMCDVHSAVCNVRCATLAQSTRASNDRLTHVQLLFTWNPSHLSLQSCYTNKCYFHQDLRHKKFRAGFRGVHLIIYLGTPLQTTHTIAI